MSFYRICPRCGAALDPGECCDCERADNQLSETDTVKLLSVVMGELLSVVMGELREASQEQLLFVYGFLK